MASVDVPVERPLSADVGAPDPSGRPRAVTAPAIAVRAAWFAVPIACLCWMATRYRSTWYWLDEWETIRRTTDAGWSSAFTGHNGHLEAVPYAVYHLQGILWGFEGHQLVFATFCLSLVAFQLAVAGFLWRLGLPTLVALAAATMVVFFGPGAENMVIEVQFSTNLALALSIGAGYLVLSRKTTPRSAIAIAGLLVLAVGVDSAIALIGAAFVGVMVVLLWPWRLSVLALVPPLVAHIAWFLFGDTGTYIPATFHAMTSFAFRLLTLASAGLVGGGDAHAPIARALGVEHPASEALIPVGVETLGFVVLTLATVCVVIGIARHRLSRRVVACLVGGLVATIVAVTSISYTRAFLFRPEDLSGSRFVQYVAVFPLLALAPAIAATICPLEQRARRAVAALTTAALVAIFIINLHQLWPVRQFNESWMIQTRSAVGQTVTVLGDGCGGGREPKPGARPTSQAPAITVGLVQELLRRGDLTSGFGIQATPEIRRAVCGPVAATATLPWRAP